MATETNPFVDVKKMIEQFKLPGLDMTPIIDSRRKDIEALVEANKAAVDAMQALARKQTEIFTETIQGIQESVKSLVGGGAVPDVTKQAELVRQAYAKALADMKDMAQMAQKSQTEAMAAITQRATQSLAETKTLMQPKK